MKYSGESCATPAAPSRYRQRALAEGLLAALMAGVVFWGGRIAVPALDVRLLQRPLVGGLVVVDVLAALALGAAFGIARGIALRARAARVADERILRRREAEYRQLFTSMLDGFALHEIILDAGGVPCDYRFLAVNPAFERLTGLKGDNLMGRTVREVLPLTEPRWIETYGRVAMTGEPLQFENYSGELNRHFVVSAYSPAPGQFACVFSDNTQRRRAEAELRDREERYRVLVNALSDALFVCEVTASGELGPFLEINEEACRRLGYSRDALLGMRLSDLVPAGTTPIPPDTIPAILAGEDVTYESEHVAADGTRLAVEMRCCLTRLHGSPAIIALARDIAERKRVECEHRRVQEQIQHVQKLEGLGLLAGGIAHDFNNLLMAILGNADLALDDLPVSTPGRQNVGEIKSISLKAADLCRQLLAYSGKGKFVVEPLDLSAVVEDMAHLLTVSVSKKAGIRQKLARGLPAIMADAAQIRQVVMNLVINASEAIGDQTGVISLATEVVDLAPAALQASFLIAPTAGRYVLLEVSDTGAGMDEETRERIFDPFFSTKLTGRGLGLAAVLGIVRGHAGAIKVYSEPGRGSCFSVFFPISGENGGGSHVETVEGNWRASGLVLLVDDEEKLLTIGRQMLERIGFSVVTARNGRQALAVFAERSGELALVLMDLSMPQLDGDAACREMRARDSRVPVVLTSGYNEQELMLRMAGHKASGFLHKPYSRLDLVRVVRPLLEAARVE